MDEKKNLSDRELENVSGGVYVLNVTKYKIFENCTACGLCLECPCNCITIGATKYEIDMDACIRCGFCAARCTEHAIHPCYN